MSQNVNRRRWLESALAGGGAWIAGRNGANHAARAALPDEPQPRPAQTQRVRAAAMDFIARCARPDGGYAASPDPAYVGNSDTSSSDLAAATYAVVLQKTLGEATPRAAQTVEFIQGHQKPDGRFVNHAGKFDPDAELAILYNTTQGAVALRSLGARPKFDPEPTIARMVQSGAFEKLPWYTTSFFPLFYAALSRPFPQRFRDAIARHMAAHQAQDGYLQDHVAATFHLAHFYRLAGLPTPRAERMVARVLRDQAPDGGWAIKEPDWDVHAAFDAVFILRQLGGDTPPVKRAIARAAEWVARCQNSDGGFGHYPGKHSDMDAVYFQLGTLVQAGTIAEARLDLPDAQTLGWGHAMQPGRVY
jgi:prenyltransferase beta subunit